MYFRRYDLGGKDSVDATAFAYAEKRNPITNADRIRAMTDEELAEFLARHADCDFCKLHCTAREKSSLANCVSHHYEWLNQEVRTEDK